MQHTIHSNEHAVRRGGAVIIVVMSLMTALLFMGLFFYQWTSQERANAEYFAAPRDGADAVDPLPIFDNFLRQAIVGPRPLSETQSVFHGGHHSMLAHLFGRPVAIADNLYYHPFAYNGRGITVSGADADGDGYPDADLDLDGNGTDDTTTEFTVDYSNGVTANETNFILNLSRSGNAGTNGFSQSFPAFQAFQPNAGYTYPDANSMFLAFNDDLPLELTPGDTQPHVRVVIPSYFRPQLFTLNRAAGSMGFQFLYEDATTAQKVLRPHANHIAITGDGSAGGPRYLTANGTVAVSGDRNRIISPFPFYRDRNGNGVRNEMGVFSAINAAEVLPPNSPNYELDGDVDRDGVPDSILLDLGHPIVDLAGGRQVVPLAMMKWIDNDGLLNVNAHGNLGGLTTLQEGIDEDAFSRSNQAMSSFEVNLQMGLNAEPPLQPSSFVPNETDFYANPNTINTLLVQHLGTFGTRPNDPTAANRRLRMSNMEMLFLLTGRGQFTWNPSIPPAGEAVLTTNNTLLGRYGDANLILPFMAWARTGTNIVTPPGGAIPIPVPGAVNFDDDSDAFVMPIYANFGHPTDHLGIGTFTGPGASSTGNTRLMVRPNATNAFQYPGYDEQWIESRLDVAYAPSPMSGSIIDEPDETAVEPAIRVLDDALFPTSEVFQLHASELDREQTGTGSRLLELAPFNLKDNRLAHRIRKRFTTDSWDRLEKGIAPFATGNRSWEFNEWEESGDTYELNGVPFERAFPPQFGAAEVFSDEDPVRDATRRLLTSRMESEAIPAAVLGRALMQANGALGQRLNINRVLEGILGDGSPNYQRLPPHSEVAGELGNNPITTAPPAEGTSDWFDFLDTPEGAEYLARLRRQQMARDIYVLLYMLGSGDDSFDPTTTPYPAIPDENGNGVSDLVESMAQFAVNVVDALDPDNHVTLFEYDRDLSNGWQLDDNPYTDTDPGADRMVVRGVEAQLVTISETLFVHCEDQSDIPRTEWNDDQDRSFCYIELQNVSPETITFNNDWQIRLDMNPAPPGFVPRLLTLNTGGAKVVQPGDYFLIGSAGDAENTDAGGPRPSYIMVDGTAVAPKRAQTDPTDALDLDLITSPPALFTLFHDESTTASTIPGDFFPPHIADLLTTAGAGEIIVTLRRRMNSTRTVPPPIPGSTPFADDLQEQDNPWIEVDRVRIDMTTALTTGGWSALDIGSGGSSLDAELAMLKSRQRPQPFNRSAETASEAFGSGPVAYNSLGEDNVQPAEPFTLWQPHFNRDFTSLMELFSIPLCGPDRLTEQLAYSAGPGNPPHLSGYYYDGSNARPSIAGTLFLDPEQPTVPAATGNRWHRLLEFLFVPQQNLERIADQNNPPFNSISKMRRTPGHLNLNMIRHEAVMAGLIDDEMISGLNSDSSTATVGFDTDRVWFRELLRSRDMADPFLLHRAGLQMRIPGLVGSRPFRPTSHIDENTERDFATRHTSLRMHSNKLLPADPDTRPDNLEELQLFEARATGDVGTDEVDFHTRHRILAKALNNSTNRSHVFSGWIEIVFHEAHQLANGAVQVGAQAEGLPTYRMFCVVDMSRLEEAYDPNSNTFDFRKFIIHQQLLP